MVRTDLGYQARGRDADGAVEIGGVLHALVQQVCGAQGWTVEALGARDIEVRLVHGRHFHQRREGGQHVVNFFRILAVAFRVAVDEDCLRADVVRGAERHGGVDAEFARRI